MTPTRLQEATESLDTIRHRVSNQPRSYELSPHDHSPSKVTPAQKSSVHDAIEGDHTQVGVEIAQILADSLGEGRKTVPSSRFSSATARLHARSDKRSRHGLAHGSNLRICAIRGGETRTCRKRTGHAQVSKTLED
ncbi:uncharacterized protein LMH87_007703 [Akanthomyces muscarius]|uniref:Uncharacterized protein n=1 Tax=Akanthomyces muscarius TaxID=2231603 RepID=A0A9W8UNQ8_AKAMU|nr:uncharacterized protein LMH87_007703 [Akanthomyces muscarius]KAJ4161678.1 hypothetical protein LMH87_007703 [Akanthomyces muscarius]